MPQWTHSDCLVRSVLELTTKVGFAGFGDLVFAALLCLIPLDADRS